MASEEALKKMMHAIMDKRKTLGIPDWGMVPVEDVLDRLNRLPDSTSRNSTKNLAENPEPNQNDPSESSS